LEDYSIKNKSLEESLLFIINELVATSSWLTKSQQFDLRASSRITEEVHLWLDVLKQAMEDFLENTRNPTSETAKWAKEIEHWAFGSSPEMTMLAEAIYIGFRIEPDLFKSKLREWIRMNRAPKTVPTTKIFQVDYPFETHEQFNCLIFDTVDMNTDFMSV
jgi:hypothetical protein